MVDNYIIQEFYGKKISTDNWYWYEAIKNSGNKELQQITKIEVLPGTERTRFYVGDNFIVEATKCVSDFNSRYSLMNTWKRYGYIKKKLKTYVTIDTYFTDDKERCYGWFNPTVLVSLDGRRLEINFDLLGEYNIENVLELVSVCISDMNEGIKLRQAKAQS